ncbi:MAG TPA: nuclear transport factor 2 family protein [Rectinemataceae bacterium]|nr:nuclear transport factor 2 family protein [Rectinemataceae bacterium]
MKKAFISLIPLVLCTILATLPLRPQAAQQRYDLVSIIEASDLALTGHDIAKYMTFTTGDFVQDAVASPKPVSRADFSARIGGRLAADPKLYHFQKQILVSGDLAFFDECSFVRTNPLTGLPFRVFHADIVSFENGKMKVMTTFGEGAAEDYALGRIEATLPQPPAPGSAGWPEDPRPTGLKPMAAHLETLERLGKHDMGSLGQMLARSAKVLVSPLFEEVGRDSYVAWMGTLISAFPDLAFKPVRSIDLGGGWVVSELVLSGSNTGSWLGNQATGRPISVRTAYLGHYGSDGLATSLKWYLNSMTILGQLGLKPRPLSTGPAYEKAVEAAIRANFDRYSSTLMAGDAEGWLALWDEDGVQLPPNEGMHMGKAEIRNLAVVRIPSRPANAFSMKIDTQEVKVEGGLAFARGVYSWSARPKDSGPLSYDGKFLTVFRKQADGSWKIFRDCFNSNLP